VSKHIVHLIGGGDDETATITRRGQFTRMWQSTISLRYVSYKNADFNLHERIYAMAMMSKSLLWSCAQIIAPRPPINPQRPNSAATGNGAMALRFQIQHFRCAVLEQCR
jgi:hypothetical protein